MTATATEHADQVVAFYQRLTEKNIPSDAALLLSIEFTKGLVAGHVKPGRPDPAEQRAVIDDAAARKREARAAELEERT